MAFFYLSGNILLVNIWFVINVHYFIRAGLTNFINREEIHKQRVFACVLSIVLEIL